MASLKQQILDEFEIVRRQRDIALKDLDQAQEIITVLESEIKAIKFEGDLHYSSVADELEKSKVQVERTPKVKFNAGSEWIGDVWLCNSDSRGILKAAEEAWKEDRANPQLAILIATDRLKINLVKKDRIRCKLFVAAIQLSVGILERACVAVNECMHDCDTDPRYRELAAMSYYIRGRIFAEMKMLHSAHWNFSMAVLSPDYHEKAKAWRGLCETRILQEEDQDDGWDDTETDTETDTMEADSR